jgi:hypothetical protein
MKDQITRQMRMAHKRRNKGDYYEYIARGIYILMFVLPIAWFIHQLI